MTVFEPVRLHLVDGIITHSFLVRIAQLTYAFLDKKKTVLTTIYSKINVWKPEVNGLITFLIEASDLWLVSGIPDYDQIWQADYFNNTYMQQFPSIENKNGRSERTKMTYW